MTHQVRNHLTLSKRQLIDCTSRGSILQTGGTVVSDSFTVTAVANSVDVELPSIETFVLAESGEITPTGSNRELNAAWLPVVGEMAATVTAWLSEIGVVLGGDGYITASITRADEVNGEAHFDDDMYTPNEGVGVAAVAADRTGPRICNGVLKTITESPRHLLSADEFRPAFEAGELEHDSFDAHTLVAFPQFGQLHAGPGPCGGPDDVRHLLVFRASTTPTTDARQYGDTRWPRTRADTVKPCETA